MSDFITDIERLLAVANAITDPKGRKSFPYGSKMTKKQKAKGGYVTIGFLKRFLMLVATFEFEPRRIPVEDWSMFEEEITRFWMMARFPILRLHSYVGMSLLGQASLEGLFSRAMKRIQKLDEFAKSNAGHSAHSVFSYLSWHPELRLTMCKFIVERIIGFEAVYCCFKPVKASFYFLEGECELLKRLNQEGFKKHVTDKFSRLNDSFKRTWGEGLKFEMRTSSDPRGPGDLMPFVLGDLSNPLIEPLMELFESIKAITEVSTSK